MSAISNRYEFVIFFDVENGNPNGDPDAGNMPRIDPETGYGLVTDVCLKRKIRNYVETVKEGVSGYRIYVKDGVPLNRSDAEACAYVGVDPAKLKEAKKKDAKLDEKIRDFMCSNFFDIRAFGAVMTTFVTGSLNCGQIRGPVQIGFARSVDPAKLKEAKKKDANLDEKIRDFMCSNFFDIRAFGAVMTTFVTGSLNCGQIRGPVQIGFARSVDPIIPQEVTITRVTFTTEKEAETKNGNTQIGRKYIVPYGLYRAEGYISANLARKTTGFSEADLELLWQAILNMFELDHSAARGKMSVRELIVFRHDSELGNAPAYKLFDLVKAQRNPDVAAPRAYSDYQVSVDEEKLPAGVTCIRMG